MLILHLEGFFTPILILFFLERSQDVMVASHVPVTLAVCQGALLSLFFHVEDHVKRRMIPEEYTKVSWELVWLQWCMSCEYILCLRVVWLRDSWGTSALKCPRGWPYCKHWKKCTWCSPTIVSRWVDMLTWYPSGYVIVQRLPFYSLKNLFELSVV